MTKLLIHDVGTTHVVDLRPGESLVVGRAFDCDFRLLSEGASRRHLAFRPDTSRGGDLGLVVEDLRSTNGTSLNQAPLAGVRPIAPGDTITLGGCVIRVFADPVS